MQKTIYQVNRDRKNWLLSELGTGTGKAFQDFCEAKTAGIEEARAHPPSQIVIEDSRGTFEYIEYDESGRERRSPQD